MCIRDREKTARPGRRQVQPLRRATASGLVAKAAATGLPLIDLLEQRGLMTRADVLRELAKACGSPGSPDMPGAPQ